MTNEKLLSQTINFLRFPLAVGVVFIHNDMSEFDIQGKTISFEQWPLVTYIIYFFSNLLPRVSVPLFFFISGYLFFYKTDFDKTTYIRKLKSRRMTLLVPYLIWNFVGFLILLTQMLPQFSSLFPLLQGYRIDISVFLKSFWIFTTNGYLPINEPLWYLRDLIILVLISPLLYWILKRFGILFLVLMSIIWYFSLGVLFYLPGTSHTSIIFFPLGAYFAIHDINFAEQSKKAKWFVLAYVMMAILDLYTVSRNVFYFLFHNMGILTGTIVAIYLTTLLIETGKAKPNKFLCNASFFVFVVHGLFVRKFMKAIVLIIQPQQPLLVLFIYFFVPIATILICLFLYKWLYRFFPNFTRIATGGR